MARARRARSETTDEIPLARRSKGLGRPNRRLLRALAVLLFISVSFLGALFFNPTLIPRFSSNQILDSRLESPTSDGRLLGHFPYSEAQLEDLTTVYEGLDVHKDTHKALVSMTAAARADGIDLILLSGYRSHSLQEEIFFQIKSSRNQTALERARVSAPPGYSEHSTGYAIDLGDATRRDTDFKTEFEETRAFEWLDRNAAKYHFVLSFPKGNFQGVSYEPWHWRFEGTADALREFEDARRFLDEL